ncbi:hypothetical protein Bbelb_444160, partial [Branchiostoma belcheri]
RGKRFLGSRAAKPREQEGGPRSVVQWGSREREQQGPGNGSNGPGNGSNRPESGAATHGAVHGHFLPCTGMYRDRVRAYNVQDTTCTQKVVHFRECTGHVRDWTRFVCRDPNDPGTETWPPCNQTDQSYIVLDTQPVRVAQWPRTRPCAFWREYLWQLQEQTDVLLHNQAAATGGQPRTAHLPTRLCARIECALSKVTRTMLYKAQVGWPAASATSCGFNGRLTGKQNNMGDQTVTAQGEGDKDASSEDVDSKPQRAISDIGAKNRLSWYNFFSRGRGNVSGDVAGQEAAADESSAVTAVESETDTPQAGSTSTPTTSEEHSSSLEDWFLSNEEEHEDFISEVQLDTLVIMEVEEDEPVRPTQRGDWYTLLWRSHSESSSGSPSEGDRRWSIADELEVSPVLTKIMEEDYHEKDTGNKNGLMCDLEHLEMTKDGRFAPLGGDPEEPLPGKQVGTEAGTGTEVQKDLVRQGQIEKSLMRWLDAGFQGNVFVEEAEWEDAQYGTDDSYGEGDESYDSDDEDEDVFVEDMAESSPEAFSPFLQGQGSDTPNEAVVIASCFGIAGPYVRSTLQRRLSVILELSDSDSSGTEPNTTEHETSGQEVHIVDTRSTSGKQPAETTTTMSAETNVHNSVGSSEGTESEGPSINTLLDCSREDIATLNETVVPDSLCPAGATEDKPPLKAEATKEDIIPFSADSSAKTKFDTENVLSEETENVDTEPDTSNVIDVAISLRVTTEAKPPSTDTTPEATVITSDNELDKVAQPAHIVPSAMVHSGGETTEVRGIEKRQTEPDITASVKNKADKLLRMSMTTSGDNDVDVNERNDINANNIRTLTGANEVETTATDIEKYIHMTLSDPSSGMIFDIDPTVETVPCSIATAVLSEKDRMKTQNQDVDGTTIKCEIFKPESRHENITNEESSTAELSGLVAGEDAGKDNDREDTAGTDKTVSRMERIEDNGGHELQTTDIATPLKTSVDDTADTAEKTGTDSVADELGNTQTDYTERLQTTDSEDTMAKAEITEAEKTPYNSCDMDAGDTIDADNITPRPETTDVTTKRLQTVMHEDKPAQMDIQVGEEHSGIKSSGNDSTKTETIHNTDETKSSSAFPQEFGAKKHYRELDKIEGYEINNSVPEMQVMNEWLSAVLTVKTDQVVSESIGSDSDSEDETRYAVLDRAEVYVWSESGSDSEEEHESDKVDVPIPAGGNVGKNRKGRCAVHSSRVGACPKPCACFSNDGEKYVNCSRADLTSVPAGIPTDVQQLLLSGNGIAKLSRTDFAGLKSLVGIDLSSNQLTDDAILPGTFDDLPFLGVLNLAANENFTDVPKNLPAQLYTLYFDYNKVTRVTEDSFRHLPQLVYVDFENNQVENIAPGSFEYQHHLTGLSIGFNQITELPDGLFKTTKLQYLGLRFNQLTRVPVDLPGTLTDLDLVGNKIKEIPSRVFSNLTELQTIQVWQQETLTTIGDDAFDGLGKLQILDADFCSIDRLTNATLSGLSGMWELYMGSSRIPYIPTGAFHDIKNITTLWLDGNQLTTLDPVLLDTKTLPRLSEVFIWDNPWTCDCHLRWLKEHIDNNNTAPTIDSPHIMVCNAPPKLKGRAFDTLTPKDFVCEDGDYDPSTAKSSRPGRVEVVRDERMHMPFTGAGKSLRVPTVWRDENMSICTPAVVDDYSILCMAGVVLLFLWVGFSMGIFVGKIQSVRKIHHVTSHPATSHYVSPAHAACDVTSQENIRNQHDTIKD